MTDGFLPLSQANLNALVEEGRWDEILTLTCEMGESELAQPEYSFFRGLALTELNRPDEAIPVIEYGLSLNPHSDWGNKLLFDAYRTNNELETAFERYGAFINGSNGGGNAKAWYVQWAAEFGLFELAGEMNEQRAAIRDVPRSPRLALAVQCFCKSDTLEKLFESLLNLDGAERFALVILQDSNDGSINPDRYQEGFLAVKDVIRRWHQLLLRKFYSVECLENSRNLGTAPTCRRLLDHVTAKYEGFLFIEDDCLLAPSALDWVVHHLDSTISEDGTWFVTCESSYFDREDRPLPDDLAPRLQEIARSDVLKSAYVLLDFVPSTCFGTTSAIWKRCANIRSFTRGPESLNRFVASKGVQTLAPVVPKAADIGMLHDLGYSVAIAGAANVRERKGTYVLAEGPFESRVCGLYQGDVGILFSATSKLEEDQIAVLEKELHDCENKHQSSEI